LRGLEVTTDGEAAARGDAMTRQADDALRSRRGFLRAAVAAGVLGAAGVLPLPRVSPRAAAQSVGSKSVPRTGLTLLGTQGGPNYNGRRSETASAVIVDGHPYLVDCGYGTLAALIKLGIGFRGIDDIFLTHLHDDHTADLAALLGHQWTDGRVKTTSVHGPVGTARLVDAALDFGEINAEIRLVDEQRSVKPADIVRAVEVDATSSPREVFRDERIHVRSVENTHYPEKSKARMPYRSLAYRFDGPDRSIVFSGDTNYSENLVKLAQGADVLVCETIEVASMRRAFDAKVANGAYADNPEGVWAHIVATHASTEIVGRMAQEAGVRLLVLNHLVPGALGDYPNSIYLEGVRKHYAGDVIVGLDGMSL
jgi:ribonuclease BN (tRNA processing enzyme)